MRFLFALLFISLSTQLLANSYSNYYQPYYSNYINQGYTNQGYTAQAYTYPGYAYQQPQQQQSQQQVKQQPAKPANQSTYTYTRNGYQYTYPQYYQPYRYQQRYQPYYYQQPGQASQSGQSEHSSTVVIKKEASSNKDVVIKSKQTVNTKIVIDTKDTSTPTIAITVKQISPSKPEFTQKITSESINEALIKETFIDKEINLAKLTDDLLLRSTKKKKFLTTILPIILEENQRIREIRQRLKNIFSDAVHVNEQEKQWLRKITKKYRVKQNPLNNPAIQEELLKRVDVIAPSMALAQAANESAWGTSRFSRLGNNLFGIWTYNEAIGIKPLKRDPGKKHFVRKFKSYKESVSVYMHTLNTHSAYEPLRNIRYQARLSNKTVTGHELAKGLEKYSAKGQLYIRLIQEMIEKNNFDMIGQLEKSIAKKA